MLPAAQHERRNLVRHLNRTARAMGGTVGLAVEDLRTGWCWFRHADTVFPAASLIKLPILMTLYHEAAAERIRLEDEIVIYPDDPELADESSSAGLLANLAPGRLWRADDLAALMIMVSDNLATNALIDRLGAPTINQCLNDWGLDVTRLDYKIQAWDTLRDGVHNLTTPREMHRLLKLIWERKIPFAEHMTALLAANQFSSRIPFYLDPELTIAHKTGTLRGIVHDIGIIYAAERPFIFCGLTKDQRDHARAGLGLARLARLTHDGLLADQDRVQ